VIPKLLSIDRCRLQRHTDKEQRVSRPILTVFGATGAQGGGLARAVLADPQRRFALRAVTRKPEGEAAQALAQAGADVVAADLDDPYSVRRALDGAHRAFFVTNFWEHYSPQKEVDQALIMATAAARAGIRHAVWSTLEDTRELFPADGTRMPVLQGKYNVPHLDAKGEANRIFAEHKLPTTYLYTSFYWENLIHFGLGPRRDEDGRLRFTLPMGTAKLPGIATEDIGRSAFGIFTRGPSPAVKSIGIAGEHLNGAQMAAELSAALGEEVEHADLSPAQYRALGFPGADELGNMFQFKRDFEARYRAARSVEETRALNPALQSFSQWLGRNARRIPLQ
jgi:uncharacterized protein YbjT (DUF2867 family)